jgi:regulatory protein
MSPIITKPSSKPYTASSLEQAALRYAARYATTRAKLNAYLQRKLAERGWSGDEPADVESLVERFSQRGYVNDVAYAETKAASLLRRGYGGRRIEASLRAAGIDRDTADMLRGTLEQSAETAALAYARRRKLGPFSQKPQISHEIRKSLAAMMRAGHGLDVCLKILRAVDQGGYPDEENVSPDID